MAIESNRKSFLTFTYHSHLVVFLTANDDGPRGLLMMLLHWIGFRLEQRR